MDNLKRIEQYLDGSLNSEDKKQFEQAVIKDKKLADEFLLNQEVNGAILDDDIVNFRRIIKNIAKQPVSKNLNIHSLITAFRIPLAAAVLILIVMSLFKIVSNENPSKLYTSFYEPYSTDMSTRSVVQSKNKIQLSYSLYQEGDYEASFEILNNYLTKNFDDQTAHFYMGLNALELHQFDLAVDEFSLIVKEKLSPFELHARWYLALTYLKTGNVKNARLFFLQLSEEKNIYSARAKKIIRKLKVTS